MMKTDYKLQMMHLALILEMRHKTVKMASSREAGETAKEDCIVTTNKIIFPNEHIAPCCQ